MTDTTLLLLPGLLCDRAVFEPLLPALAPHASCKVAHYACESSIGAMAEKALEGAPWHLALLGHSMGGRVALEVLRRAPERVERIALLDTGYQPRAPGDAGEREAAQRMALLDIARRDGMRAMAIRWINLPMVHRARLTDEALVEAIVAMFERRTPDDFAAQIAALLDRPDASDVLPRIDCPALVLCGRDDAWASYERHVDLHHRIATSRLVAIDDCGHMAPMEQPAEVSAAIVGWLDR